MPSISFFKPFISFFVKPPLMPPLESTGRPLAMYFWTTGRRKACTAATAGLIFRPDVFGFPSAVRPKGVDSTSSLYFSRNRAQTSFVFSDFLKAEGDRKTSFVFSDFTFLKMCAARVTRKSERFGSRLTSATHVHDRERNPQMARNVRSQQMNHHAGVVVSRLFPHRQLNQQ